MGSYSYRENYLAALEVAHSDLDYMLQECEFLQLRKKQLEGVMGALEPFLRTAQFHQPEPVRAEQNHFEPEPEVATPVFHAVPAPEPVIPAAFSPMAEAIVDPIQSRINRALGLAVA